MDEDPHLLVLAQAPALSTMGKPSNWSSTRRSIGTLLMGSTYHPLPLSSTPSQNQLYFLGLLRRGLIGSRLTA